MAHKTCHTVTFSHWHIVTLSHYQTVTLSHCQTVTPSHCHIFTLSNCHTVTWSHCHTVRLSNRYTVTLSHRAITTISQNSHTFELKAQGEKAGPFNQYGLRHHNFAIWGNYHICPTSCCPGYCSLQRVPIKCGLPLWKAPFGCGWHAATMCPHSVWRAQLSLYHSLYITLTSLDCHVTTSELLEGGPSF